MGTVTRDSSGAVELLRAATDGTVNDEGQGTGNCPVCGNRKKFTFRAGTTFLVTMDCKTCPASQDEGAVRRAWVRQVQEAAGVPEWVIGASGTLNGSKPSAPSPATRKVKPATKPQRAKPLPTDDEVGLWRTALLRERTVLNALCRKWHITEDNVMAADVGWVEQRNRVAFPVRDFISKEVVQVLYRDIRDGVRSENKVRTHSGVSGSYLYAPFGIKPGRKVILCAGEHDLFSAHEAGFNAVSFTSGERSVPTPDRLSALSGRDVVTAYDIDDAGRRGERKAAAALASIARTVAVADLTTVKELPRKGDVADVLRTHGAKKLRRVLREARPWEEEIAEGPQPVDWGEFWSTDPEPIRYHVEPLIACAEVTRIYSQAKVGKSLIAQESAAALTMGGKVLGYSCEPTDVLYIDQENTWDDWKTRLADMGYGPDDNWSRLHWYSLQSWPPLDGPEGGALVVEKVLGHGAGLVVIDTQSKVLDGEEDKAPTSAAFYRHTLLPLKRLGVAVVIIDHAGNDPAKPRGSSGKRDDVDVVWQIVPRTRDKLTLKRTHSRKRHAKDVLYVNRVTDPLRHELATEDERDEEMVDACIDAILALEPRPDYTASQNFVIKALREARGKGQKGYRDATVREAWRRITGVEERETP